MVGKHLIEKFAGNTYETFLMTTGFYCYNISKRGGCLFDSYTSE